MGLKIKVIKAGNGDAILLSYKNSFESKSFNILIDGGNKMPFHLNLKLELLEIIRRQEKLDLLIVTHIDLDHIGGIITFFEELKSNAISCIDGNGVKRFLKVEKVWFNANELLKKGEFLFSNVDKKIGVGQGADLQLHLENMEEWEKLFIARPKVYEDKKGEYIIGGAKITILGPEEEFLIDYHERIKKEWEGKREKLLQEKHKDLQLIGRVDGNDKNESMNSLILQEEQKRVNRSEDIDTSDSNLSSIAILFEYEGKSILLLGDSPGQIIAQALKDLGFSEDNPLKANFTKLAHHASVRSTNFELLSLIQCHNFIISTDGGNHNLPNKAAIAKIISAKGSGNKFYLNYPAYNYNFNFKDHLTGLDERETYDFKVLYSNDERGLVIEL